MWHHIKYKDNLFSRMLNMIVKEYGVDNDISKPEFIIHEYFSNPSGNAIINLAVDNINDELAGQYIVLPMKMCINGNIVKGLLSLNTLTNENYRGQGIFTSLAEITYSEGKNEGFKFCYGMPNPNSYPGFINSLSFYQVAKIPLWLYPLNLSDAIFQYTKSKILRSVMRPANIVFKSRNDINNIKYDKYNVIKITNENIYLIDELWDEVRYKYSIMNVRNSEYIKYRYIDIPNRNYTLFMVLKQNNPVAFAVNRVMDVSGIKCGMIVDLICVSGFEDSLEQLIEVLILDLKSKEANLIGCLMLDHTKEAKVLKNKKFFKCPKMFQPQPFPLIVRSLDENIGNDFICDSSKWFFTMGDYDVI